LQSLTSSSTRSPGPPCLQIDKQNAYNLRYVRSSYACKAKEINLQRSQSHSHLKSELPAIIEKRSFSKTFSPMSDISYQGLTYLIKDCAVSLESNVNIWWCRTCSTKLKPLINLGRNRWCTCFYFPSKYFVKRFTDVKTSLGITWFPWFIFCLCERRFHIIKSHIKFWYMENI
jgi:hypothetical protein